MRFSAPAEHPIATTVPTVVPTKYPIKMLVNQCIHAASFYLTLEGLRPCGSGVQCGMANHLEEFACEVCGKLYRIGWSIPKDPSLNEVAVAISHCPLGKALLTAGVISFEELLDGQWVAVEPYVHTKKDEAA
jgi:hypothetical protein